ncbi:MAG: FkbM family methyltransferase [Pseudolabrys sp.]
MSALNGFIRSAVLSWVVEAARRGLEKLDPFVNLAYSQDGEDMILRRLFEGKRDGFYVDVGAHDPYRFSNTCYFHRLGWRGINIEPNPEAIARFLRHRPLDTNVCVGVSEHQGTLLYYFFNDPALNTFDEALAQERIRLPGYHLVSTKSVPVRRLDELLAENLPKGQDIAFLSIDVEGLDLSVLRSNDWSRFRPRILLVEARERKFRALEDPISEFARRAGYDLIAKTVNTLIFEDGLASVR